MVLQLFDLDSNSLLLKCLILNENALDYKIRYLKYIGYIDYNIYFIDHSYFIRILPIIRSIKYRKILWINLI